MSGEVYFVRDMGGKLVASVPSLMVAESSVTPNSSGLSLTASESCSTSPGTTAVSAAFNVWLSLSFTFDFFVFL